MGYDIYGNREVNAPLREAPELGTSYAAMYDTGFKVMNVTWLNDVYDRERLYSGNAWATRSDATAACDALVALLRGGE